MPERRYEHGWMEGRVHVWPRRVYYADTDAAGVVYHSNYLVFAEEARTECMRCLGVDYPPFGRPGGVAYAIRHCVMDFQRPALLDDRLVVLTEALTVGGASLEARQTIVREPPTTAAAGDDLRDGGARQSVDGAREVLVVITLKAVCIDASFKAMRLPADVRAALTDKMMLPPHSDAAHAADSRD
ncbi:MAG: YbgC/FadM family acyl-CoA thioesterase [Alphaproteobacteria bacterium]|nr:MAG: YbgC/FadM family acyl-CoA thioesterase [Alphaproteobacteria bacterium]